MTTDLNQMHLCMIQRLKELSTASTRPEEIVPRLLLQWFTTACECFEDTAAVWDVDTAMAVCISKPLFSLVLYELTTSPIENDVPNIG